MILFVVFCLIIAFIICMKKFNYDFKGIELIIFWISFILCLVIEGAFIIFPITFFGIYYLINVIKTKRYIKLYMIVIQFILSIIFLYVFCINTPPDSFGALVLFLIFMGQLAYMLTINFIIFIINLIINRKNKSYVDKIINKATLVFVIIAIFLLLILFFNGIVVRRT